MESSLNGYIFKTIPASKAQRSIKEVDQDDYKSQMIREFAMRLCLYKHQKL